jgi:ABC-type antimicrobial peptide transport system ATPase subunit
MQPPLLDVRGFGLEFRTRSGTVRALEGIDLTLRKGEIVGLVGEMGQLLVGNCQFMTQVAQLDIDFREPPLQCRPCHGGEV